MFPPVTGVAELKECQRVVAAACSRLDPDAIPVPEADRAWGCLDAMERLVSGAKLRMARRLEEAREWSRAGFKGPAEYLAARSGKSVGAADAELETSKRLSALGDTADALRRGELSGPQAQAISDAAAVNPSAERWLVEAAGRSSLSELREACGRTKAAADPDREATHRRIQQERRVRRFTDGEGAWNLSARGTPAAGAAFNAALEPVIGEIFHAARVRGEREPREAYAFDALVELARRAQEGNGAKPQKRPNPKHLALIRVDLEALTRGQVEGEEPCEITGMGPVPVRVARDLPGESVLKLVVTKGLDLAHLGRGPSAAQRLALLWMMPEGTAEGCTQRHTEADHRAPWAATKVTTLSGLDNACDHHHDLKTYQGWAFVAGKGKRAMVPPHDPRHPDNRPPPEAAEAGPDPPAAEPPTERPAAVPQALDAALEAIRRQFGIDGTAGAAPATG